MTLRPRNPRLLAHLSPFVVATPQSLAHLDLSPFGIDIDPANHVDPLRVSSTLFLDLLTVLDRATFGPEGMPMPRWVFVDGAELPGAIVGLGCPVAELSPRAREMLQPPDGYQGLVPLAMYVAIPTWERGVWLGHNLASMAPQLPEDRLKGLGSLTKALALKVFRAHAQVGITQWDSEALYVHTKLGPLEMLTAWTPAHSEAESLTYRATVNEGTLRSLARDPDGRIGHPEPEMWIDCRDHAAMQALQVRIEAGERFCVAGPPDRSGEAQRVPVARLSG